MDYSYEQFLKELGAKLRQMRIERGWTLRDMITHHGFHLAHWQGFEKGKGMSLTSLLRLCAVFDLTLEELIAGLGRAEAAAKPAIAPTVASEDKVMLARPAPSALPRKRAASRTAPSRA